MAAYINVRIGRLPGRISEITLNGDRTVASALTTAGLTVDGYDVRVQGAPATLASTLSEGDIVLLVKKIKGNGMLPEGVVVISVGRVPGGKLEAVALGEPTVYAALQAAGIAMATSEVVYVNDRLANIGEPVQNGDTVVVKAAPPAPASAPSPSRLMEEAEEDIEALEARAEKIAAEFEVVQRVASALSYFRSAKAELEAAMQAYDELA